MIAQLIAMVLITRTQAGTVSVQEHLSPHACDEAQSFALHHQSIASYAESVRQAHLRALADAAAVKAAAKMSPNAKWWCSNDECLGRGGHWFSASSGAVMVTDSDIIQAECVR